MIQSPMNYTGGKFRLLPQILPLFPEKISSFIDLFCGGCNVGINVTAERHIYNDVDKHIIELYHTFRKLNKCDVFNMVEDVISKYGLSMSSQKGYEYYGCKSGGGLGDYNRNAFNNLKQDFNANKETVSDYRNIMLYVLIVYSFNNQIRFNGNGDYNLPVGKRDFNKNMSMKLSNFIDVIHSQDSTFLCNDFRNFDIGQMSKETFVYVDPPYLITCATYNEKSGWTENDERDLLFFLDELNSHGIRFALSNVLSSKGKRNQILTDWIFKNTSRYNTIQLKYSYANSNYQTKGKNTVSEEVLVVNY